MASIFTYQDEPPRIHSPWSTPGTSTPQPAQHVDASKPGGSHSTHGLTKLEPERHDGPTEYKLHLLLRPRRNFVSMSTTSSSSGPHYSAPQLVSGGTRTLGQSPSDRPLAVQAVEAADSLRMHARQTRLQQLTTQLLWRLQQSSPFHSSSNADLVLPVLPEATPRLGVPERPAKLLPGLEESQGALYEIGVADDGTLVGLVAVELQESLTNLGAMAASLGCTTNVLRKLEVGSCEWERGDMDAESVQVQKDELWVAEVLVYPDAQATVDSDVPKKTLDQPSVVLGEEQTLGIAEQTSTEQLRVSLVGATTSGKSSLLGTLSTSALDNGRGKSRLSLLKHRHEIASGVTSSVAHELLGYRSDRASPSPVINYASGNVSSWIDVHNLADRLVFLSDSPGLPRFAKSTIRSLISWSPSWTILCVAADDHEGDTGRTGATVPTVEALRDGRSAEPVDISLSHLDMSLRFHSRLVIVITKMDLARKSGLRVVLAKLLSALKAAGRKPVMLGSAPGPPTAQEADGSLPELQSMTVRDQVEVDCLVASMQLERGDDAVPILMTSAVTGLGISKLHALLRSLPISPVPSLDQSPARETLRPLSLFHIDEVFSIPPSRVYTADTDSRSSNRGVVLCGNVSRGVLSIGNVLFLGPFVVDSDEPSLQPAEPVLRSRSCCVEQSLLSSPSGILARSYQGDLARGSASRPRTAPLFVRVRIVSLRNLQLPVVRLRQGETGTIGIEPLEHRDQAVSVERTRKGMVLLDADEQPTGYRSFSASFPSSDFSSADSPPLILGGHAIVYVNSVRAAVKVTSVALEEGEQGPTDAPTFPSPEVEMFHFDSDDESRHLEKDDVAVDRQSEIKISFRFVSTVEWMELGDQILVVPTVTAPGPITGAAASHHTSGLTGFVGRINEILG